MQFLSNATESEVEFECYEEPTKVGFLIAGSIVVTIGILMLVLYFLIPPDEDNNKVTSLFVLGGVVTWVGLLCFPFANPTATKRRIENFERKLHFDD